MKYDNLVNLNKNNNNLITYPFLFFIPNELLFDNLNNKIKPKKISYNTSIIRNMNKLIINTKDKNSENEKDKNDEQMSVIKKFLISSEFESIIKNNQNAAKNNINFKKYWKIISRNYIKSINKNIIKFPINDKELFSFPDLYKINNVSSDSMKLNASSNIGDIYPFFNGDLFCKIVNIYDFLVTFSHKMYLNKFTLEEFYSALKISEKYINKEILAYIFSFFICK